MIIADKIKLYIVAAILALSVSSSIYFTAKYKDGQYAKKELAASEQYTKDLKEAQEVFNSKVKELNEKALEKQSELAKVNSDLERKYANAKRQADETVTMYVDLVNNGWRMRDPGTKQNNSGMPGNSCNCVPGSTDSGNGTSGGGELSQEASRFLLGLASDADRVVEQLKISQEYATRLKAICESQ